LFICLGKIDGRNQVREGVKGNRIVVVEIKFSEGVGDGLVVKRIDDLSVQGEGIDVKTGGKYIAVPQQDVSFRNVADGLPEVDDIGCVGIRWFLEIDEKGFTSQLVLGPLFQRR